MDQVVAQALSLYSRLAESAALHSPQQKGLVSIPVELSEEGGLSAQNGGGRAA
jgi:hypothetical protein